MISRSDTYASAIARSENSHYLKFIDQLIAEGNLDTVLNSFLGSDDIANIVALSLIKLYDLQKETITKEEEITSLKNVFKTEFNNPEIFEKAAQTIVDRKPTNEKLVWKQINKALPKIELVFKDLPLEQRKNVLMILGIERIIHLTLDEINSFADTMSKK